MGFLSSFPLDYLNRQRFQIVVQGRGSFMFQRFFQLQTFYRRILASEFYLRFLCFSSHKVFYNTPSLKSPKVYDNHITT